MSQTPNLFIHVGKQVKDEYERAVGKIASFVVTPSGKFDAVFIEQGDGKFAKHSIEHLKIDGEEITLLSKLKTDACALCDQIPLIWRKDQALEELSSKNKISPDMYNELHSTFDGALGQLKSEAQILADQVNKEIEKCNEEIRSLNYALVYLEIEHEIGKLDDQAYETAFTMVQENIKRLNVEKSDCEVTRNKLSNTLLGDKLAPAEKAKPKETQTESTSEESGSELPEPPVVVYVKEIGKTGI